MSAENLLVPKTVLQRTSSVMRGRRFKSFHCGKRLAKIDPTFGTDCGTASFDARAERSSELNSSDHIHAHPTSNGAACRQPCGELGSILRPRAKSCRTHDSGGDARS